MTEIKCIFQEILLDNQDNIFEKYNKLVNEVNKGCKTYNKKEMKKYFIFNPENFINNITECTICFFNNYYEATILYEKNGEKLDKGFGITKYEFTLENKTYRCYERSYLIQYLENEYKKKKFYLKVLIDKYERINYSIFIQYNLRNFEIVYYYNYKPVTFKELTLEFAFNEKEQQKGEELNYEFANYIDLEEEEYNLFFYIKNFNRNFFLRNLEYRLRGMHYIELCGPFGCGKTITLLKYINCFRRRSYYINLWTVNYVEIQELKKILKYEYVKLIGKNYDINNEKDEIVSYINNLNSSKEIYDFILKVISSFKNTDKNIYLIIDQYSSKYDEKNKKIKEIKEKVINTNNNNNKLIICSSINNYDVKENIAYSLSCINKKDNTYKNYFYFYVGCLLKLDPNEDPLKNESPEFKNILSLFGNLPLFYYNLKKAFRTNIEIERFMKIEGNKIKEEIIQFFGEENKNMKIELAKILFHIKQKHIFLFNEFREILIKMPLKFLEIKKQKIKIFKLLKLVNDYEYNIKEKILEYSKDNFHYMETLADNFTTFMNSEKCLNDDEIPNLRISHEDDREITIFFIDFLFQYVSDIISRMIYIDNIANTQSFFSDLSPQIQEGIIECYILEHIRYRRKFIDIKIDNFESVETFVPNSFYIQNYSSFREDTEYKYNELKDRKNNNKKKEDKKKIKIQEKNILIKQLQSTGKYYDFAIVIYLPEKKGFYLIMFQVSKKKFSSQRLFKEEHEIVLGRVKEKLENEFDIKIIKGGFCYIFTDLSSDNATLEFCKYYNIPYIQFSFQKMEFNDEIFKRENCFITNNFPFHNNFSILSKEKFELTKNFTFTKINNYEEIANYKNNFTFEYINDKCQETLSYFFKAENRGFYDKNEFAIFGYFDIKENFSNKFCIWYDTKNTEIIFDKGDEIINIKEKLVFNEDGKNNKKYILICSKYENVYKTDEEIKKMIEKLVYFMKDYYRVKYKTKKNIN